MAKSNGDPTETPPATKATPAASAPAEVAAPERAAEEPEAVEASEGPGAATVAGETELVPVGEPGPGQIGIEQPVGTTPEPETEPRASEYTLLTPMNRNGKLLKTGDRVTFEASEALHVQDLLDSRAIVAGTGEDAQAAVEAMLRARAESRLHPA